jgi:hypothetical protein
VEGLNNFRTPAAFSDPPMVTMPYPTATHYRHAHLKSKRATPGKRGDSHSKQGCLTDARSVGRGYGRWLVFHTSARVPDQKKPGKWSAKLFSASCLCVVVLPPAPLPTCPRGDGKPRLGEKSRREERLRPWGGAYGMRRRDRRATARRGFFR